MLKGKLTYISLLAYGKTEKIEAWLGPKFRLNERPRESRDIRFPFYMADSPSGLAGGCLN